MHYYITRLILALDAKKLDINMTVYFSGNNGVHNINSRIIVFINWNRKVLGKPKLPKHRTKEPKSFDISYISNQIQLCGNLSIYRFIFRPVNSCTSRKSRIKSSSESPLSRLSYVCSIHKTRQFSLIHLLLVFGDLFVLTIIWNLGSGISNQGLLQF